VRQFAEMHILEEKKKNLIFCVQVLITEPTEEN
jgi:hypothetical protein